MNHFLRDTGFRIAVHLKRDREGDRGGGERERELSHETGAGGWEVFRKP